MKTITAADYALFYTGNRMIHTLYHNGVRVTAFETKSKYHVITLYHGGKRTLRDTDTLQVINTNKF